MTEVITLLAIFGGLGVLTSVFAQLLILQQLASAASDLTAIRSLLNRAPKSQISKTILNDEE
jgi:hypothetical protein